MMQVEEKLRRLSKTNWNLANPRPQGNNPRFNFQTRGYILEAVIGYGMSVKEVAGIFGCSKVFVYKLIHLYKGRPDRNIVKRSKV